MTHSTAVTKYPVIYRDKWIVIVNKPEGVLSHPNPQKNGTGGGPCAFEGRYDFDKRCFDTPEGPHWLIHRIDRDTSGVLLAVSDAAVAKRLRELWDKELVEKKYMTLVGGQVASKGVWRDRLFKQKESTRVRSMVSSKGNTNAELEFTLKRYYRRSNLSFVEIRLLTGRTHQIRVQFTHREHPLAGDRVYGDFTMNRALRDRAGLKRLFLHASLLGFRHPSTGKYIKAEADLPVELSNCLARLS